MKYDFTTYLDRSGKDSLAADEIPFEGIVPDAGFPAIPMWIADMSFVTAPPVLDAVQKRLAFPNFGYFRLSEEYFEAILRWQRRRNSVTDLQKEQIGYENGVLGGVSAAIQAFSAPGDKILVHAPTYVGFTATAARAGRTLVHSRLVRDEAGVWRMNYDEMDRLLRENNIRLAIFCSPHNPSGRVWERWELERAMEIYAKNDCVVISDEIWSDIILPGHRHIPTQAVSEDAKNRTIAFYAPSKTFSLAGFIGSYHIIYNAYLRDRLESQSAISHYNSCNVLSMHALIGAFSEAGEAWADEMLAVIDQNVAYACDFIRRHFAGVEVARPQGTYMLYLDCARWCAQHGQTIQQLLARGVQYGVIWQNGEAFQWPDTIRMNLALPFAKLQEAMDRLQKYVF